MVLFLNDQWLNLASHIFHTSFFAFYFVVDILMILIIRCHCFPMVPFDIPRETVYRNYQLAAASIFNVLKCVNLGHVVRVPVVSS